MDFRAYARQAADQQGEEHISLEPAGEGQDLPHACSYCGAPDFENPTDNGRAMRATCTACGGTMISHGGAWQPDLIGQPDNHPKMNPDPGAAGDEGRGIPIRVEDLGSRSAGVHIGMPGKRPAPDTTYFDTYDAPEGSLHHEEAEESHPGWSHHLLRAHDSTKNPEFAADHYNAHMVGSIYYSRTPEGSEHPGVAVHDMSVNEKYRGKGYASAMQDELRRQHPDHMIDHGSRTPSGSGWASQHTDAGDPRLDLNHPDNAGTEHRYRPTELARQLAEKDLSHLGSRTAGVDWCRHRHAEHCWIPRHAGTNDVALYIPQDRGACPWITQQQQMINCPVSEPGPMAGMQMRGAMYTFARFGEPTGPLLPVKHAGFKGHVEAYDGHDDEMNEQEKHFDGDFDEDLYDESRPQSHEHERAHFEEHGDYPDSFHERHDEAYSKALTKRQEDTAPVGHHTSLINFIHSHGDNHSFWQQHAPLTEIDHSKHSVYATQPFVVQKHLDKYMGDRHAPVHHVQEYGPSERQDQYHGTHHPMMVKHEGNLFAIEGHHRTASDILSKRPTKAYLFDADKHGFPDPSSGEHGDEEPYEVEHPGLHKYAKKPVTHCDYGHLTGRKAKEHAVRHHDDGICVGTEARREKKSRKTSSLADPELRFHMLAAWRDVREKARRIRTEGGVAIVSNLGDGLTGHVNGDTGVYETQINYVPGTFKIGFWQCGCAWASYAWGRSPAYRRFEGRMCSHALALQYEAQSRGMFGREVHEDTTRPGWMRDKVRVRHDRDTRDHDLRAASRQAALDPDGVYPSDHGIDLERAPIHALAEDASRASGDPAEALKVYLAAGVPHSEARGFLGDLGPVTAAQETPDEPTHAGVALKAADTGRVVMIQRSNKDPDDPAAGTWEFPGGGREPGDHHSLHSGIREFEEEVGQPFPLGGHVQHVWRSPNGVYQGHVVVVPDESCIDFSNGRATTNPDDPDGDDHEQSAWLDPDKARKYPDLRSECKGSPWSMIKAAGLQVTAGDSNFLPGHPTLDLNNPEHTKVLDQQMEEDRKAGIDHEDLSSSPTITRGFVAGGHNGRWHPDVVHRIAHGQATAHDLLHNIDTTGIGDFWHGHHRSLEDAKVYAEHDDGDHVGHELGGRLYEGHHEGDPPGHIGEVGVVVEAHRPQGWDPNKNPDDGIMGNSYLAHPTDLALHRIHYDDHEGNWHHVDATGHTVHATGYATDSDRHLMPDYPGRKQAGVVRDFFNKELGERPQDPEPEWRNRTPVTQVPDDSRTCAHDGRPAVAYDSWLGHGLCAEHADQSEQGDRGRLRPTAGKDWAPGQEGGIPASTWVRNDEHEEDGGRERWSNHSLHNNRSYHLTKVRSVPVRRWQMSSEDWETGEHFKSPETLSHSTVSNGYDLNREQRNIGSTMHFRRQNFNRENPPPQKALSPGQAPDDYSHLPAHMRFALGAFRERVQHVADYSSHDALEDLGEGWRPKPPSKKPDGQQENPGSTGFATSGDPDGWDSAVNNAETMSLNSWGSLSIDAQEFAQRVMDHYDALRAAGGDRVGSRPPSLEPTDGALSHEGELHQPSEPALPSTTADDEEHDVVGTPGERYRSQMIPQIDDAASVTPSDGRTAAVSDAVQRFQASNAGQALASTGSTKEDSMDIAQAARNHIAGGGARSAPGLTHTAVKTFNAVEQQELINEGGSSARARNFADLNVTGTHYADIDRVLAEKGDDAEILFL